MALALGQGSRRLAEHRSETARAREGRNKTKGAGAARERGAGGANSGGICLPWLKEALQFVQIIVPEPFAPPAAEFHSAAGAPKACGAAEATAGRRSA